MFKLGTVPFFGDYIDIAPAPAFVPTADGNWALQHAQRVAAVFHAVWTDNRDVRAAGDGDWTKYTPPDYAAGPIGAADERLRPDDRSPPVTARNAGSRNQNIYTARIAGGLLVGSPGNAKPLQRDAPARLRRVRAEHDTTTGASGCGS